MSHQSWFPSRRLAALEEEVRNLTGERDRARSDLDRVTQQRDELRRIIGDVRSYARQEAERAVVDNMKRRDGDRPPWAFARDDPAFSARHPMRPTVASVAHLNDPEPPVLIDPRPEPRFMLEYAYECDAGHVTTRMGTEVEPEPPRCVVLECSLPTHRTRRYDANVLVGAACTCLQDEPRTWACCPVHPPGPATAGPG